MIDEVKKLLAEHAISNVAIVDDAYDEQPHPGDIEDGRWDRFFDDILDADEEVLRREYGPAQYDASDSTDLRRDSKFLSVVWGLRGGMVAAAGLCSEFERRIGNQRADLDPLRELLQAKLGLTCQLIGREYRAATADANIVFLDLYLGHLATRSAADLSIKRIKDIVLSRRESPPLVVLMSANPTLNELGPSVRDDAELLGCQFRMIRKAELADPSAVLERLFDLLSTYRDSLKLNTFVLGWQKALGSAQAKFLRTIRTLDLADYANMQALILEAENEPVGDYAIDLYDLHLHNVLEGDEDLIRSAKALNGIDWSAYPPAQFMPSPEAVEIMDGATFHNEVRTRIETEMQADSQTVHLGDVLLEAPHQSASQAEPGPKDTSTKELPTDKDPENVSSSGETRHAFVVLSQACDLQHGEADRVLLLRGVARPYSWKQYEKAKPPRTPVMKVGKDHFSVGWDVLAPETWTLDELANSLW